MDPRNFSFGKCLVWSVQDLERGVREGETALPIRPLARVTNS